MTLRWGIVLVLVSFSAASPRIKRIPTEQGGKPAIPHSYPWMISLTDSGNFHCAGTLIRICADCNASDIILTAAHCVVQPIKHTYAFLTKKLIPKNEIMVIAGKHWQNKENEGEQIVAVKEIVYNSGWNPLGPSELSHDIAVVQTVEPIRFSKTIRGIDLQNLYDNALTDGSHCKLAGWGYKNEIDHLNNQVANQLQEIPTILVDGNQCVKDFPESRHYYDEKWMTCAVSERGASTSCNGDSGSAMVCKSENGPLAYGIVSFGGNQCGGRKKTVYTTIRPHLTWIYSTAFEKSEIAEVEFLVQRLGSDN